MAPHRPRVIHCGLPIAVLYAPLPVYLIDPPGTRTHPQSRLSTDPRTRTPRHGSLQTTQCDSSQSPITVSHGLPPGVPTKLLLRTPPPWLTIELPDGSSFCPQTPAVQSTDSGYGSPQTPESADRPHCCQPHQPPPPNPSLNPVLTISPLPAHSLATPASNPRTCTDHSAASQAVAKAPTTTSASGHASQAAYSYCAGPVRRLRKPVGRSPRAPEEP